MPGEVSPPPADVKTVLNAPPLREAKTRPWPFSFVEYMVTFGWMEDTYDSI
jgi:hypothetical protein